MVAHGGSWLLLHGPTYSDLSTHPSLKLETQLVVTFGTIPASQVWSFNTEQAMIITLIQLLLSASY